MPQPLFAEGHNSLYTMKSTTDANGNKIYIRTPNSKLSDSERRTLLDRQKNREKKPLSAEKKEEQKRKAVKRYDDLLAAANRSRKRAYAPRPSKGLSLNILR